MLLDKVPLSWYLGPVKGVESHNYYMAFTDAEHTVSKGRVTLKEAGYLFVADLYAVPGEDAYTLPEGEYMASQLNEDHTFTSQYTGVQYIDAEGNKTQLSLVSGEPLKVSREVLSGGRRGAAGGGPVGNEQLRAVHSGVHLRGVAQHAGPLLAYPFRLEKAYGRAVSGGGGQCAVLLERADALYGK